MKNCCVIGPVKSGTTLMISLLDAHPELSLFPLEVKFFTHWLERLSSPLVKYEDLSSFFLEKSKVRLMNRDFSDERDVMNSGRIDFSGFDFKGFRSQLESQSASNNFDCDSEDELFVRFYEGIHAALNQTGLRSRGDWIVSKEGNHGAKHIDRIREIFPGTKFIVLCRDPRDIFASFKAISQRKADGLHSPTFNLYVSPSSYVYDNKEKNISAYEDVYSNYRQNKDFLFVKYESLVNEVSKEMFRVAQFLGIEFDEVLTRPTNLGNIWGGNASEMMGFNAVWTPRVSKWQSKLTESERRILERFLFRYLSQCNYFCENDQGRACRINRSVIITEVKAVLSYAKSASFVAVAKRVVKTIGLSWKSVVFAIWAPEKLGR